MKISVLLVITGYRLFAQETNHFTILQPQSDINQIKYFCIPYFALRISLARH
jgi:hypothetical protein